jgi:hypothetical protein
MYDPRAQQQAMMQQMLGGGQQGGMQAPQGGQGGVQSGMQVAPMFQGPDMGQMGVGAAPPLPPVGGGQGFNRGVPPQFDDPMSTGGPGMGEINQPPQFNAGPQRGPMQISSGGMNRRPPQTNDMMERMPMDSAQDMNRLPPDLSGGQMQRPDMNLMDDDKRRKLIQAILGQAQGYGG